MEPETLRDWRIYQTIGDLLYEDDLSDAAADKIRYFVRHFKQTAFYREALAGDARAGYPVAVSEYLEELGIIPAYTGE